MYDQSPQSPGDSYFTGIIITTKNFSNQNANHLKKDKTHQTRCWRTFVETEPLHYTVTLNKAYQSSNGLLLMPG